MENLSTELLKELRQETLADVFGKHPDSHLDLLARIALIFLRRTIDHEIAKRELEGSSP